MATKTNLLSAINAQLTAIITQAKHRLSMLEIVNEIYPTIVNQNHSTTNTIIAKNAIVNLAYDLNIVKSGRKVTINGSITNTTTEIIGSVSEDGNFFFEVVSSEFLPSTSETLPFFCYGTDINTYVFFINNKLYCRNIPSGEQLYFNITYFTEN